MKFKYFRHFLPAWFQWLCTRSKPHIHVIGDSHGSYCFTNVLPVKTKKERSVWKLPFSIHWLGPVTMFRIGRDGIDLKKLKVRDQDLAVFVFGEIDVRCHIEKQSTIQNKTLESIVEELATRYVKAIVSNRKNFKQLRFVVCLVVPPTDRAFNAKFPIYGELKTRIAITRQLNAKLREICTQEKIPVLDLYGPYSTEEGDLLEKISDGNVHISPNHNEAIKEKLLGLTR